MDRNGFLTVIFVFLIASDSSSAYSVWKFRKLIGAAPKDTSPAKNVSPLPSPVSSGKGSKSSADDGDMSGGKKPKDHESMNDPTKVNPKASKSDNNTTSANTQKQIVNDKNHEETNAGKPNSPVGSNGSCQGSIITCSVQNTLIACIQGLGSGYKDLVLVIQNEGEGSLKVNTTITASLKEFTNETTIPTNQTKEINVFQIIGQSTPTQIVVKTGNKECTLPMGLHSSAGSLWHGFPSYYKKVTPVYGAYLFFLIALVVGGTWACCKFRKRRRNDGVPYQELEMGLPESASAVNADAAEGWDEGWDDDWDEDNAVKSPGGRHVGRSISASGLTARSSNRDGWGKDWDD